jgi:hypothetical protein
MSPFAKEAKKYFGDYEPSGKIDDITVIAAQFMTTGNI